MVEKASPEFRLTKIDETRYYFLEEIKHNDLMSEKYKKTCKELNYVEHLLILVSTLTGCVSISKFASIVCVPGCVSISKFASIVCVPVGITSSAVGIKISAVTVKIKKHKPIIKKKRKKKHDAIEVLTSKALIDSYISQDEFVRK